MKVVAKVDNIIKYWNIEILKHVLFYFIFIRDSTYKLWIYL